MAIGPAIIRLYTNMRLAGLFNDVRSVAELGSQVVYWPEDLTLLAELYETFGQTFCDDTTWLTAYGPGTAPARYMYPALGIKCTCFDIDGQTDVTPLDLNFDVVPEEHLKRHDLVTNFGTTEHVFNQLNAFRVIHDLARPDGLMLHSVPLGLGGWDHGLFAYQPALFVALTKANAYTIVGSWISPSWKSTELRSYVDGVQYTLKPDPDAMYDLVLLLRKTSSEPFRVPLQQCYEETTSSSAKARYW